MTRKYGEEQRAEVKKIREELINELERVYLKAFNKLNKNELGAGFIAKVTQLILLSRDGAITPLTKEIESKNG